MELTTVGNAVTFRFPISIVVIEKYTSTSRDTSTGICITIAAPIILAGSWLCEILTNSEFFDHN